jgi:hypothetical protein
MGTTRVAAGTLVGHPTALYIGFDKWQTFRHIYLSAIKTSGTKATRRILATLSIAAV